MCAFCIPVRINCSASTFAKNAAGIASRAKTTQRKCRSVLRSYCIARAAPELKSAYCPWLSISDKVKRASAASWESFPWPGNTVRQLWKMPALRPWRSVCRSIASCAVISPANPQLTLRQVDPLIRELTEYRDFINLKTKEQTE